VNAEIMELAVTSCLVQCVGSDFPMTALSDYADKLRDNGWNEATIEVFERQVLTALTQADRRQNGRAT